MNCQKYTCGIKIKKKNYIWHYYSTGHGYIAIAQLLNKKFTISLELPYLKQSITLFICIYFNGQQQNEYIFISNIFANLKKLTKESTEI